MPKKKELIAPDERIAVINRFFDQLEAARDARLELGYEPRQYSLAELEDGSVDEEVKDLVNEAVDLDVASDDERYIVPSQRDQASPAISRLVRTELSARGNRIPVQEVNLMPEEEKKEYEEEKV